MIERTDFLTRHAPDLLDYFRRRVGDSDAPDLLSETMVTAWRRIALLPHEDEAARRWMFGIARNVLLNAARTQRRQTRVTAKLRSVLTSAPSAPASDEGIDVRDAIARLDPHLAEIVTMVHWDGFTLADVAEILGTPASTIRNHYQRAKQDLAAQLRTSDHV